MVLFRAALMDDAGNLSDLAFESEQYLGGQNAPLSGCLDIV